MNRYARIVKAGIITLVGAAGLSVILTVRADGTPYSHVLLLSVDGLHASDLDWFVATHPDSTLAQLSAHGRTYTNATATKPSDSFPGMLAMVTGGTPKSTGVYYDDAWDRSLAAAGTTIPCAAGTRVRWKQNLDVAYPSFAAFDDFKTFWSLPSLASPWPLDPSKLPRDPALDCSKVYPHQFPRVNNVFELIKGAGGRTAWADKHPAYEFLMGRSGTGIDDLYTPEIATLIGTPPAPLTSSLTATITDNFELTMNYDALKVAAIVNEINGYDHAHTTPVGTPALFGMNFQAVSVGQKLDMSSIPNGLKGGYLDGVGTPSQALAQALTFVDESIGTMVATLQSQGLLDSTLIIISAKHGNSPIDPAALQRVDPAVITSIVNSVAPGLQAQLSADTGPLIWLKDQSKTAQVAAAFDQPANRALAHVDGVLWGPELAEMFADPLTDSRAPDLILLPTPGTVYVAPVFIKQPIPAPPVGPLWTKIADHGGFGDDDVHVALLVSNSLLPRKTINDQVETRQIACTILKAFNLDCGALESQSVEPSKFLPHSNHDWAYDNPAGTLDHNNR